MKCHEIELSLFQNMESTNVQNGRIGRWVAPFFQNEQFTADCDSSEHSESLWTLLPYGIEQMRKILSGDEYFEEQQESVCGLWARTAFPCSFKLQKLNSGLHRHKDNPFPDSPLPQLPFWSLSSAWGEAICHSLSSAAEHDRNSPSGRPGSKDEISLTSPVISIGNYCGLRSWECGSLFTLPQLLCRIEDP